MRNRRTATSQSAHDQKVQRIANGYRSQGYRVQADVEGFTQPHVIDGHRPDVIATKPGDTRLIEVETPETKGTSHATSQEDTFRAWGYRGPTRTVRVTTTKEE